MTPCSEPQPAVIDICQPGPNLLRTDAARSREFVSYVRSFCRAAPLWPIVEHLRIAFNLHASQPVTEQLGRLERSLRDLGMALEEALLLNAELLDVPYVSSYPSLDLSPQQRRNRTLQVLNSQFLSLAIRKPTLFVLEDAHWVDPTTLELLEITLQSISHAPVLVVVSSDDAQLEVARRRTCRGRAGVCAPVTSSQRAQLSRRQPCRPATSRS